LGRNPQALQRSSEGEVLPHACLRNPAFVRFIKDWVDTVASAGAQTIFWDEPHVAMTAGEVWACACEICVRAFGGRLPDGLTEEVLEFRQRTALEFIAEVSRHAQSKGLQNSVCLYPLDPEPARRMGLPALLEVARLASVDDVGVDPYPVFQMERPLSEFDPERFVGGWARRLAAVAEETGKTVHLWIQGFLLPEGFEHLVETCAEAARRNGVSDIAFWGYRAAEVTSLIRPSHPDKVWAAANRAFGDRG
jgi:hypothetical protein